MAAIAACSLALLAAQVPNRAAPAPSQTAAPPSVISVETNLVLVRVVVRDAQGNAVTGLRQSDFQLYDNGKPQTIAYFSAENASNGATQPATAGTSATTPTGAQPASASAPAPTSRQRATGLFFDDYHMQFEDLAQTRQAAQGFIGKALSAGDRIGIFTASGKVTLDFTTDADKLQKALSQIRIESRPADNGCPALPLYVAQGVMDNDPDAVTLARSMATPCVCPPGPNGSPPSNCSQTAVDNVAQSAAQAIVAQSDGYAQETLAALQKLVRYIGELPGEHRIGMVSDGFRDRAHPDRLNQIIDAAIRNNVTISALDAHGLAADSTFDVASESAGSPFQSKVERAGVNADAEVMQDTAGGTGGVFVRNTNDYKSGFDRIGAVAEASYVLGFAPNELAFDGRYHKLKIIVTTHSNWTVQARPGYFATPPQPESPASAAMQTAMQEAAGFKAIQATTDPAQQIQLSQDFLAQHPASRFAEPVSNLLVAACYAKQDWNDFYAASASALAKYPDDVDVLVLTGWVSAHLYDPNSPAAAAKLNEAETDLNRAIEIIPTLSNAAGLTDEQFAAHKSSEILLAHRGLGLIDFLRRDYLHSVQEFQQAIQGEVSPDPSDLRELGIGLQQLDRYDEAGDAFKKCAQIPGGLQGPCKQLAHQVGGAKAKARQTLWSPPDVDARLPLVSKAEACSLPDVLTHAGERAQELVDNFPKFTAREKIQYDELDAYAADMGPDGGASYDYSLKVDESADFDYVVSLKQMPGAFLFDENLRLTPDAKPLTGNPPVQGLTSLALIFHPYYQGDYEMRCEGLADWNGTPAWVIHFAQRKDKPSRTRGYVTPQTVFPEQLKGRAWIAKDSYQVLHIDTNLLEPVLLRQDQTVDSDAVSVDYGPVEFRGQNVQLWLPQSAETFTEVARKRVVTKDTFSDFALFSVEIKLKPPQP
ncbi:MAG: VWA domain-containing protein [Candidatus Acidiferrales bacterium]